MADRINIDFGPDSPDGRLAALQKAADERKYNEKREATGFDNAADYDAWLVLEQIRTLTKAEAKAAADAAWKAANPEKPSLSWSGGLTNFTFTPRVDWVTGRVG